MEEILNRLTVSELRSLARRLDIPGRSTMNKSQLVASVATGLKASELNSHSTAETPSRHRGRRTEERRAATRRRLETFVDSESVCDHVTAEGLVCGLPQVRGSNRCTLHGGTDSSDLAIPATGSLGFETWPALFRHLQMASYDIDALGLDPIVAEMLWHLGNYLYFDFFRVETQGLEHVPGDLCA